jgi:hypothetical protein
MSKLHTKILQALQTKKFNPEKLGERKWYNFFISVNELFWARNFIVGYLIHVYSNEFKSEHLATYTLSYDYITRKDILEVDYENNNPIPSSP